MALTDFIEDQFVGLVGEYFTRNGKTASGRYVRNVAKALNHLVAKAGPPIIPPKMVLPASARNSASELTLWRNRYRSGPNGTRLLVEVHRLPTDDTAVAGAPHWYVNVDGAKATDAITGTQDNQVHTDYCAAGSGTDLDDVKVMRQEISLTAGAKHTLELVTRYKCRIVSWSCREKPKTALVSGTDTMVDWARMATRLGVYDEDVAEIVTLAQAIHQKLRGVNLSYSVDDPASPIVPSTTATNPWDATTARTGVTAGPLAHTQYRNTYMNEVAATLTIPMYLWAYGERTSGGGSLTVRFVGENGNGDVTINAAANVFETTSWTLKPQSAGDKFDVHVFKDVAGTTGNIYSFGAFPLIGT